MAESGGSLRTLCDVEELTDSTALLDVVKNCWASPQSFALRYVKMFLFWCRYFAARLLRFLTSSMASEYCASVVAVATSFTKEDNSRAPADAAMCTAHPIQTGLLFEEPDLCAIRASAFISERSSSNDDPWSDMTMFTSGYSLRKALK